MKSIYESFNDEENRFTLNFVKNDGIFSHFHKSIEILYVISGSLKVFINGQEYILEPNEIYFVPSFIIHSNKNIGDTNIELLIFSNSFFSDFSNEYKDLIFPFILRNKEANIKLLEMLQSFEKELKENPKVPLIRKKAFVNNFLYEATKIYPLIKYEQTNKDKNILDVLTYINQHFVENITLHDLATRFAYNEQYLSRLFNQITNTNLSTYINNLRLEHFEELKTKEKLSLSKMIEMCGFQSVATYYRAKKQASK